MIRTNCPNQDARLKPPISWIPVADAMLGAACALCKPQRTALPHPVERDVSGAQQLAPGKFGRLASVDNGGQDVRREPGDAQQLPEVPLAIMGHAGVRHAAFDHHLRRPRMRHEAQQRRIGLAARLVSSRQRQPDIAAAPHKPRRDCPHLVAKSGQSASFDNAAVPSLSLRCPLSGDASDWPNDRN